MIENDHSDNFKEDFKCMEIHTVRECHKILKGVWKGNTSDDQDELLTGMLQLI